RVLRLGSGTRAPTRVCHNDGRLAGIRGPVLRAGSRATPWKSGPGGIGTHGLYDAKIAVFQVIYRPATSGILVRLLWFLCVLRPDRFPLDKSARPVPHHGFDTIAY